MERKLLIIEKNSSNLNAKEPNINDIEPNINDIETNIRTQNKI